MLNSRRCCHAFLLLTFLVVGGIWSGHALSALHVAPTATAAVQRASEAPTLSTKRIEEVQLGERLLGQNPLREEVDESFPDVDPATWRQLRLHMTKPSGKSLFIELLRPGAWLKQTGATVGGFVHLDAKEMGVAGEAKVLAIEPCPAIQDGPGNVCTGRFIHEADGNLLDLTLADQAEVTTTTPTHPYWSQDRRDFIPAGKLRPGERLKTAFGETTVVSIAPSPKSEQVYNLEIHREHVYLVGSIGTLVHNSCPGCPTGGGGLLRSNLNRASASRATKPGSPVTEAAASLNSHAGRPGWPGPKPTGNVAAKNAQAEALVDDMLNHANRDVLTHSHIRQEWGGSVTDIYRPDGLGVRFDAFGNFIGFITR